MPAQQELELRTWGGKRPGAGRPPAGERAGASHARRDAMRPSHPVHVTLRFADRVWNLRSERSFVVIHRALDAVRRRADVRVVHYDILGNHLHTILEADGPRALSSAMRALTARLSHGMNELMGTRGRVLADRYHARALRTPAEVRSAVRYVVGNFASHARRRGEPLPDGWVDPFSSAVVKVPRAAQQVLFPQAVTSEAGTWLLRTSGA